MCVLVCEDKFAATNGEVIGLFSVNHSVIGKFKFTEFSAISNQNCSSACSGRSFSLLPTIRAAFTHHLSKYQQEYQVLSYFF
jgi:hypothetical protein